LFHCPFPLLRKNYYSYKEKNLKEKSMGGNKLYVGNLPYSATSEDVSEVFSAYGTVKEAKVMEGKGFGFVEMTTGEEAEAAKTALNGKDFQGRALKVDEARPPKDKPRGGGGFGGNRGGSGGNSGFGGGRRY
jgi:RNA recognition motif-containing protein